MLHVLPFPAWGLLSLPQAGAHCGQQGHDGRLSASKLQRAPIPATPRRMLSTWVMLSPETWLPNLPGEGAGARDTAQEAEGTCCAGTSAEGCSAQG